MHYLLLLFFSFSCCAYQHEAAVCAIFNNEAPYLKEWIEYNKLIGVEKFYLYNHNSTDHYLDVLEPYVHQGVVELIDWPYKVYQREDWIPIQTNAYRDCAKRAVGVCKWIAFIDVDEFIFPIKDLTLPNFLAEFEEESAVVANWLIFGTSGVKHLDPSKLMIEQLGRRATRFYKDHAFIKTIAKPKSIAVELGIEWNAHHVPLKAGLRAVNSNHQVVSDWKDRKVTVDRIRIHHYSFRDQTFFYEEKLRRPNVNEARRRYLLKQEIYCNQEEDWSILIYADQLRAALFNQ